MLALVTVTSFSSKPVTASLKVIVTVKLSPTFTPSGASDSTTVGALPSWVIATVFEAAVLKLPAESLKLFAPTVTEIWPALCGVKVAV